MATMKIFSSRKNVWDKHKISESDSVYTIKLNCGYRQKQLVYEEVISGLQGKRVLLLVHGYHNSKNEVRSRYRNLLEGTGTCYDEVIGYTWPGGSTPVSDYNEAKQNCLLLKDRFFTLIEKLLQSIDVLDLFVHSMGNYLLFESLSAHWPDHQLKKIHQYYCTAAAIPDYTLATHQPYRAAAETAFEYLYICYSRKDDTLGIFYPDVEDDKNLVALGFSGPKPADDVPATVQEVDGHKVIATHREWFREDDVFTFIRKTSGNPILPSNPYTIPRE